MFSQFFSLAHLPWTLATLAMFAVAMCRGGPDERLAANTVLIGWLLSKIMFRYQGLETEWGVLVVDIGALAVFVWIALRSARYWPLFAAGFHLLSVVTHIARMVDPTVGGWAYLTAGIIWGYLLLATIAYGAWTSPRYAQAGAGAPATATRR
ncbi:hypothetical protein ACO2Q0_08545 [Phenylobacterium sp. VNQ135]|uniref:hypothetical protein n=1 Tax=Phenylobacterium sp. VNQ135 TaxID=3400922 RepID=UPI003C066A5B